MKGSRAACFAAMLTDQIAFWSQRMSWPVKPIISVRINRSTPEKPEAAKEIWKQMSVGRFWQLLMQDALEAYYSHPSRLRQDRAAYGQEGWRWFR
jgi:hypothetical protein